MSEVSDEVTDRLRQLEDLVNQHLHTTNNPHHTTAELVGAVPIAHYRHYVVSEMNDLVVALIRLKSLRMISLVVGLLCIITAYASAGALAISAAATLAVSGVLGLFFHTFIVYLSGRVSNLRRHVNDITR